MGTPIDGVHLFDAETLTPAEFGDDTPASAVAFSPDGRLMAAAVTQWTGGAPSDRRAAAALLRPAQR